MCLSRGGARGLAHATHRLGFARFWVRAVAIRELGIGLGFGLGMGALWRVYHSNERRLVAQANAKWEKEKEENRKKAAARAAALA